MLASSLFSALSVALLSGMFLILRAKLFFNIALRYTDSDQTVLWHAAHEMLHGRFHEPCFYGQSYNSWIEALLALPLIATGWSASVALPLVSTGLFALAVGLLTVLMCRKSLQAGVVFLSLLLTLPPEYQYITTIPRGFVTGIASAAIGVWLWSGGQKKFQIFAGSFFCVFGFVLNPNSFFVLLLLPWKSVGSVCRSPGRFAAWGGAALGLLPYALSKAFYALHPDYLVHHSHIFRYHFSNYLETLPALHDSFSPALFLRSSFFSLLVFLFAFSLLWKRREPRLTLLAALGGLLYLLGTDKALDTDHTLFLPFFRSLLALPLFLAWMFAEAIQRASHAPKFKKSSKLVREALRVCLPLLGIVAGLSTASHLETDLSVFLSHPSFVSVADLNNDCSIYAQQMTALKLGLLVVEPSSEGYWAYGCPVLQPRIETLVAGYERRTWACKKESEKPRAGFLMTRILRDERQALEVSGAKVTPLETGGFVVQTQKPAPALSTLAKAGLACRNLSTASR